jgi:hypothetical protein
MLTGNRGDRTPRAAALYWAAVALVLVALAVPWFLWRDATVVAGLPVWLWWHVGWMGLASVVFYVFTQRAWGVGVLPNGGARDDGDDGGDAADPAEVGDRG